MLIEYKYYVAPAEESTLGDINSETMIASKTKLRVAELANLISQSGTEELGTLALKGVVHRVDKGRQGSTCFHIPLPRKNTAG